MQAHLCCILERQLLAAVEFDVLAVKPREDTGEALLASTRCKERDIDSLALLTHEVARLAEYAVDAWRRNLQDITVGNDILVVELSLQLFAEFLAILDINAALFINIYAQIPVVFLDVFHVHEFNDILAGQESLCDRLYGFFDLLFCHTSTPK